MCQKKLRKRRWRYVPRLYFPLNRAGELPIIIFHLKRLKGPNFSQIYLNRYFWIIEFLMNIIFSTFCHKCLSHSWLNVFLFQKNHWLSHLKYVLIIVNVPCWLLYFCRQLGQETYWNPLQNRGKLNSNNFMPSLQRRKCN